MHRLKPAVLMVGLLTLMLTSLAAVALAAVPTTGAGPASPDAFSVAIHMSDRDNGSPMRTFVSSTHQVYAVVTFGDAANVNYQLRLRDLVGIEVYNQPVRLNGAGQLSRAISVDDFVASYRHRDADEHQALTESTTELTQLCERPPGTPGPTPVATPGGATPTPDPFTRWRAMMLDAIVSAKTTGAEFDRNLQAVGAIPDMQSMTTAYADLQAGQHALSDLATHLDTAERALSPGGPGPGTPTPSPPAVADPAVACSEVGLANQAATEALTRASAAFAGIPADTSTWRFPPTTALYAGAQFKACQPYNMELYDAGYGTTATSTSWTIGVPGEPALVFPSPDEIGQADEGQLGLKLPAGANAIYASTVNAPGANHTAGVFAFVTDAQCIPVNDVTITFGVNPSGAGAVAPRTAIVHDGEVSTTLTAGITATQSSEVTGQVDPPVTPAGPQPPRTLGRKQFNVIGPTQFLVFKVNPTTINRLLNQRANMLIRAVDTYNRPVANGTEVRVHIAEGDPGVLATDIQPRAGSRQPMLLGKSARLVTVSGNAVVPAGTDPGIVYMNNLYLLANDEGNGVAEVVAEADGKQLSQPVTIVSRWLIHLPLGMKHYDIMATAPYLDPDATPTPRRR